MVWQQTDEKNWSRNWSRTPIDSNYCGFLGRQIRASLLIFHNQTPTNLFSKKLHLYVGLQYYNNVTQQVPHCYIIPHNSYSCLRIQAGLQLGYWQTRKSTQSQPSQIKISIAPISQTTKWCKSLQPFQIFKAIHRIFSIRIMNDFQLIAFLLTMFR